MHIKVPKSKTKTERFRISTIKHGDLRFIKMSTNNHGIAEKPASLTDANRISEMIVTTSKY